MRKLRSDRKRHAGGATFRSSALCLVGALVLGLTLVGCELWEEPPVPPPPPSPGPSPPEILSVSRTSGAVHTRVEILGRGFGTRPEESFVRFGGVRAPVLSWSEEKITVRVPLIPTPRGQPTEVSLAVVVGRDRRVSNEVAFTVVRGIVFSSRREPPGLYVMNPDGSEPTLLIEGAGRWPPALWEADPSWSPDGTRIAFTSYDEGLLRATGGCRAPTLSAFRCTEIFIVNADGSALVRVTRNTFADRHPTWSPDGTYLIFSSDRTPDDHERNAQLFRIRADGTGEEQLTFNNVSNEDPDWSPDGRRVAFTYRRPGGIPGFSDELAVLDLDRWEVTTLLAGSHPAWAPDGRRLAFRCNVSLCLLDSEGDGATPLTDTDGANDDQPSWSPEGDRIVFVRQLLPSERFELWGVRTDRGSPYRITGRAGCPRESPTCELAPDWY